MTEDRSRSPLSHEAAATSALTRKHTRLHGDPRIVHMTAHMRQNLGLESQLANLLQVTTRLLRGDRRRQFNVLHAKVIQSLGNFNLLFAREEGIGELLALCDMRCAMVCDVRGGSW